jgi:hypothetical protein
MKFAVINKVLIILTAVIFYSCERGIYLMDPVDPQIIQYTEDGNNAAGALINDELWKSIVSEGLFGGLSNNPEVINYVDQDSIVVLFDGYIERSDADLEFARLEFHLSGVSIENLEDLTELDNRIFKFDGLNHVGLVSSSTINSGFTYSGQIYFRSVTQDNFSGTFSIKIGESTVVKYGRFDYKISSFGYDQQ